MGCNQILGGGGRGRGREGKGKGRGKGVCVRGSPKKHENWKTNLEDDLDWKTTWGLLADIFEIIKHHSIKPNM